MDHVDLELTFSKKKKKNSRDYYCFKYLISTMCLAGGMRGTKKFNYIHKIKFCGDFWPPLGI